MAEPITKLITPSFGWTAPSGNRGLVADARGRLPWPAWPIEEVTTLPTQPDPGQVVYFVADSTNRVIWTFRYNVTGTTYKWEFVGGPPLTASVNTGETTTSSANYADLSGGATGPNITIARAGEYICSFSNNNYNDTAASQNAMSVRDIGGSEASDNDAAYTYLAAATNRTSAARNGVVLTCVANTTIRCRYRVPTGGGTATFETRKLEVIPRRVA